MSQSSPQIHEPEGYRGKESAGSQGGMEDGDVLSCCLSPRCNYVLLMSILREAFIPVPTLCSSPGIPGTWSL